MNESKVQGGNYTIWFGHYPTSCILAPGTGADGFRGIVGQHQNGYAYLSGHLHTMGGMVPNMYTLHKEGFLELELGDWKHNRMLVVCYHFCFISIFSSLFFVTYFFRVIMISRIQFLIIITITMTHDDLNSIFFSF